MHKTRYLICLSIGMIVWGCDGKKEPVPARSEAAPGPTEESPIDQIGRAMAQFVIEPGVGMGDVRFGMDLSMVKTLLGEPDTTIGENILQYAGFAVTARDGKVLAIACGDANRTDSTFVRKCPCRTREGIGMGASEREVTAAYGAPARRQDSSLLPGDVTLDYPDKGLRIVLNGDRVHFMMCQKARGR